MEADPNINDAERIAIVIADLADKARTAGLPIVAHLLDMALLEARDVVMGRMAEPSQN